MTMATNRKPWPRARPRRSVVAALLILSAVVAVFTASAVRADPHPSPAPHPSSDSRSPGSPTHTPTGRSTSGKQSAPPDRDDATPAPGGDHGHGTTPSTPHPHPSKQQPPPGWHDPGTDTGDAGLLDVSGQIHSAMVDFVSWIAKTGAKPVFDLLGRTVLATPSVTSDARVTTFWKTTMAATNAMFVLLIVAAGIVVTSHETLQTRYSIKEILPRIVVAAIMSNTSLLLCGKAIQIANALPRAIAGQGVNGHRAAHFFIDLFTHLNGLTEEILGIAVLVMTIVVVVMFILRTVLLVVLVGLAPLALALHALPQTESLAYTWWRAFGACLGIQVAQAAVLLAMVRIFLTEDGTATLGIPNSTQGMVGVLVEIAVLWLLIKMPGWAKRFVLGGQGGRGLVRQALSTILTIKSLGAAVGLARAAGRGPSTRSRPSAASGSPTPSPTPSAAATPRRPASRSRNTVGPVKFSHAPSAATPLPRRAGSAAPPQFRSAAPVSPAASTPIPPSARQGPPQPAALSNAPTPATPIPSGHRRGSPQPPLFQPPTPHTPPSGTSLGTHPDPTVARSAPGAQQTLPGPGTPAARPAASVATPRFSDAPDPQTPLRAASVRPTFLAPTPSPYALPPPAEPHGGTPRRTPPQPVPPRPRTARGSARRHGSGGTSGTTSRRRRS